MPFTRRYKRRQVRRGEAPPPQINEGEGYDVPPIRDPQRAITRKIPVFRDRCHFCGRKERKSKPEWFDVLTMNPEDTPPIGRSGHMCEQCAAGRRARLVERHGEEAVAAAERRAEELEAQRKAAEQAERRDLAEGLGQDDG